MKKYSLAHDTISRKEIVSLNKWLLKGERLTKGKLTLKFENQFSKYINRKYSLFVNSGSSANLLMLSALIESDKLKNKKAIVAGVSWSTTLSPFIQNNFDIELCDCSNKDLGIDIAHFELLCKKHKPSIAIMVDVLGHPNNFKEIKKLCKKYNVILLEDTCEALGTVLYGKKLGTAGLASSFSFYYGHHITTIEGGMVCCSNQDHYQLLRMFRSHGMTREASQEVSAAYEKDYPSLNPLFTFALPGFNFRSTELNAVLGLGQMRKLDSNIQIRKNNLGRWLKKLDSNKYFTDFAVEGNSNFALPLVLNESNKNRLDKVQSLLRKMEVEFRLGTAGGGNLSRQPFVKKSIHKIADNQTNVDFIHDFGLYVGNGEHVDFEKIDVVTEKLNRVE